MRRTPSEDLFRLIKSLHKGEKRNFKLLTGSVAGEKNKKYIALFDMIDRQDQYNEAKLVKHFGDLYGGQFSAAKNYLHKLILKSLVHYNAGPMAEVNHLKEQVRILVDKELYGQARKLLRKALKEASAAEQLAELYELLSLESTVLLQEQNERKLDEQIQRIAAEKAALVERMANLDQYEALAGRLYLLMNNRHVARREADMVEFREIADHPLMQGPEMALTQRAKVHYLSLMAKMCSFRGDIDQATEYSKQLVALLEAQPIIRDVLLKRYFLEIGNLAIYQLRSAQYKAADQTLGRFKELRAEYAKSQPNFFPLYFIAKITLAVQLGTMDRQDKVLLEVEEEFEAMQARAPRWHEMLLTYLLAYHYNIHGHGSDALRWINLIINAPRADHRTYLQCFARLLFLMIHYDLGNYMVVESSLASVHRFLEKHDRMHAYEEAVLRALRALTKVANTPETVNVLEEHHAAFEVLAADRFEGRAVAMLDFGQWLQSKLQNTTMAALRALKA